MSKDLNKQEIIKKEFPCKVESLENVQSYLDAQISSLYPTKDLNYIHICVEEIFVNICYYSKKEDPIILNITKADDKCIFEFIDSGIKFNPLEKKDPNITVNAEDRQIGGLGIFMVKKMMDEVNYQYFDNKNHLSFSKLYSKN